MRLSLIITTRVGGRLRVIPTDAVAGLDAGTLDPRLFDVTTLLSFKYDDRRADLPLIVTGPAGLARSAPAAATAVRAVPGGRALRLAKKDLGPAWPALSGGVTARGGQPSKIWLDGVRTPQLTTSVPQIGAPAAWAAGYDGAGVTVAVVDSGVDAGHPDLAGRVVAAENFTDDADTLDRHGHGTHVAATIASTGAAPGGHRGVAPGAAVLSAKACDQSGSCPDSAILAGMQWAVDRGAKVVNLSLGGPDTPEQDPLEAAIERLTAEHGTLFVVAAGNEGGDETVSSPGSADAALTVGAVDRSDTLAEFSSRGPRVGDAAVKPDITAPGVDISAALSRDAGGPPDQTHIALSGTSMATPHVAGAAAILAQRHPGWTAGDLKAALMGSAAPNSADTPFAQGAGRVDVARAVAQTVTTSPASVSFGRQMWPHDDDTPDARVLTYRNAGPAAVTLALSLAGSAPAGLFTLSATSVTVPAGGTAAVTLTSDTRVAAPDARHGGHVVATAAGARVVTPFAVDKETERHELTINRIDRAGQPVTGGFLLLIDLATGEPYPLMGLTSNTVRLPKATYTAVAMIVAEEFSVVVDATIVLDRARTATFDARAAHLVSLTPPDADATAALAVADVNVAAPGRSHSIVAGAFGGTVYVGQAEPAERQPALTTLLTSQWTHGPAALYNLSEIVADHVPAGFAKRYTAADLGRLDAAYAGQGPTTGFTTMHARRVDRGVSTVSALLPVPLPGRRAEYYTPDLDWDRIMFEDAPDYAAVTWQQSAPTRFTAGTTRSERLNAAVFGPALGGISYAHRSQDRMMIAPGLHAPAGAWSAYSPTATGRIVVQRAGVTVYDEPGIFAMVAGLPAAAAPYRVTVDLDRGAPSRLSTHVSAEWTFRSAAPADGAATWLPLSAVRFAPPLSDTNTAPAGTSLTVPVSVVSQPGSAAGPSKALTVDVSYDDGRTWRRVPVVRAAGGGVVVLRHPATAGFVSLRASSTDTAGNTVKQTVIRAYQTV